MSDSIVMPNLGFDSQESRLVEWLKQPGDPVKRGEAVAIIESDKAEIELESTVNGILIEHIYAEDSMVPIGAAIATVGNSVDSQPAQKSAPQKQNAESNPEQQKPLASPIAKRLASEHGVELAAITGTGARGRITREDVETHVSNQSNGSSGILALPKVRKAARDAGIDLSQIAPSDPRGIIHMEDLPIIQVASAPKAESTDKRQFVPISRIRQRIAERMVASKQQAPHFYVSGEFDFEDALAALQGRNAKVNDLIQYITVRSLMHVPELNATYEDGNLYHYQPINLAVAVALDDGLIAPVIHDAGRYSLEGLAQESRALIQRARSNSLRPDDLSGGTFTISNLGVIKQVDDFVAVINPPQVGILAVGTMKQRPIVIDGGLHLRHTVKLTLSGDHRAVDGMHLARFLQAFQDELDKFSGGKS